jgi:hypothetical protein
MKNAFLLLLLLCFLSSTYALDGFVESGIFNITKTTGERLLMSDSVLEDGPSVLTPATPTATAATTINDASFTANWDAAHDITGYYLDVYTRDAAATNLIISEYIEGHSHRQALEIFNGTGITVDLSAYSLRRQINGAGNFVGSLALTGMLAHNSVYVIAYTSTSAGDYITGDMVDLFSSNTVMDFNGNDAVALYHNGIQIDVVGEVNQAAYVGRDMTLVRQAAISSPTTAYSINDWDQHPVNTLDYLGSHTMGSRIFVPGYENYDVGNITHKIVTGLNPSTTYKYVIRAYNTYGTSENSNEIAITTSDNTLPVELSSFTVALNSCNQAVLTWVTQTETDLSGFYIYRNTYNDLATAELISSLISATNTSQQIVYVYRDKELSMPGTYYYWLQVADLDGSESFHGPVNLVYEGENNHQSPGIPEITTLKTVYPNPFNPSTTVSYGLDKAALVSIRIYNSRGQMVREINEGSKAAGNYSLVWNGDDDRGRSLPTGVYYIRMQAGDKSFSKKAVLMK